MTHTTTQAYENTTRHGRKAVARCSCGWTAERHWAIDAVEARADHENEHRELTSR